MKVQESIQEVCLAVWEDTAMRWTMEGQRLYLHTQETGSRETDRVRLGIPQQDEKREHKHE